MCIRDRTWAIPAASSAFSVAWTPASPLSMVWLEAVVQLRKPASAADAGFRSCTNASNHTIDKGLAGVQATLNAPDAAGIAHVGAARSAEEAATPRPSDLGGVRVGHPDYTYGLNGQRLPASAPWIVKLIDPAQILADAKAVRAAGAQFVLVSMHWGC